VTDEKNRRRSPFGEHHKLAGDFATCETEPGADSTAPLKTV
jgi:hypothetical protein